LAFAAPQAVFRQSAGRTRVSWISVAAASISTPFASRSFQFCS
jgi:hypothetical protein